MSDLDEKLEDLYLMVRGDGTNKEDFIAEAKQAFADAGYITPEEVVKWQRTVNVLAESFTQAMRLPTKQYVALNKSQQTMQELMTGQEWYERFARELEYNTEYYRKYTDESKKFEQADVLMAAEKAAGIE